MATSQTLNWSSIASNTYSYPNMASGSSVINGGYAYSTNGIPPIIGAVGASGPTYNITFNPNINSYTGSPIGSPNDTFKVSGDYEFTGDIKIEGDVKIKGKSVVDLFERIEERLAVLHYNEELESRWTELRDLAKRYKELEVEIKEKEKMWEILRK
jgi:hypothetical protein